MTDKHANTKAGKQETYRWEFARGKGKGKHSWKDRRPAWDDAGYDRRWSDRKWDDSRFGPYSSGATAATMIASMTSRHTSAPMPRASSKPASRDSAGRLL